MPPPSVAKSAPHTNAARMSHHGSVRRLVARSAVAHLEPADEAEPHQQLERAVDARGADPAAAALQVVGEVLRGRAAVAPASASSTCSRAAAERWPVCRSTSPACVRQAVRRTCVTPAWYRERPLLAYAVARAGRGTDDDRVLRSGGARARPVGAGGDLRGPPQGRRRLGAGEPGDLLLRPAGRAEPVGLGRRPAPDPGSGHARARRPVGRRDAARLRAVRRHPHRRRALGRLSADVPPAGAGRAPRGDRAAPDGLVRARVRARRRRRRRTVHARRPARGGAVRRPGRWPRCAPRRPIPR